MRLTRRLAAACVDLVLRVGRGRPVGPDEAARADFSTHPGGKGLRFTERLRSRLRARWLRLWRP